LEAYWSKCTYFVVIVLLLVCALPVAYDAASIT